MTLGKFNEKLKEACHLRQTETFTPWSNAAKRETKELKKGSSRKLIGSLKRIWDDCFEVESSIRSNNTHSIYKLDGKFLKILHPKRHPT